MDLNVECDSTVMGSLFQQIILDMKNTSPLWDDFVAKASKLHACLRAVIQAIASYLDAFQKIADAATNSRGASKEIGTALTRVCLRHKAVETRMKTFTSAIMDCLILPLQEKLEDWRRHVACIDKEHTKEYKRCRTELKKRSNDTLRLQKKARKDQSDTIQSLVDSHMQDVTLRRAELEEVERKSLRAAMIEERMRYCTFVNMLQPVVKEECEVMSELGHLQEAMESIAIVTKDPNVLPQSSEEIILETKSSINLYPESPGGGSNSLGSRKSSVCSISSVNSSGSSGSPGHHHYQRSLSQLISPSMRLKPGESSDSGFCSSPVLTTQSSASTSQSHAISTWPPHSQDIVQTTDRPHTISSAYEKGHQRPALTVYTFQKPETIIETQKSPASISCRPPLPVRCSSLERPLPSTGMRNSNVNLSQRQCPSPIPAYIAKELPQFQPTYANMSELAAMAALQNTNQQSQQYQQQQQLIQYQQQSPKQLNSPNQSTTSSQISSDSSIGNFHQLNSSSDLSLSAMTTHSAVSSTLVGSATPPPSNEDCSSPLPSHLTNITQQQQQQQQTHLTKGTGDETTTTTDTNTNQTTIEGELKITETDLISNETSQNTSSNNASILSPESHDISRASVQQKASLFEKLEREQNANNNLPTVTTNRCPPPPNTDNNVVSRKEEIYKSPGWSDKDSDKMYEDSIKELNSLIGELDSFQREHDLKELSDISKNTTLLIIDNNMPNVFGVDSASDKISIGSLSSSLQSMNTNESRSNYSDLDTSRSLNECNMIEIKTANYTYYNEQKPNKLSEDMIDSPLKRDHVNLTICTTPNLDDSCDMDYLKENSSVVVLRCKEQRKVDTIDNDLNDSKQRLSSFRSELHSNHSSPTSIADHRISTGKDTASYAASRIVRYHHSIATKSNKQIQTKSAIFTRPASLSSGCVTRMTRRSSSNSIKPPPPVRRSSSVTPSHNLQAPNSPNLIQENVMNLSTESLPPPPAFLLDRAGHDSTAVNVAETVKALTVIRHTPASPTILRRAQSQQIQNQMSPMQPYNSSNSTTSAVYAQPKQVTKMSSFRTPSPAGSQKSGSNILAQINARLMPNKQQQQHQQPQPTNTSSKNSVYQQQAYHENRNHHQQSSFQQPVYGSTAKPSTHQTYNQPKSTFSYLEDKQSGYWSDHQQHQHQQSDAHFYHQHHHHNHQSINHSINYHSPTSVKQQMPSSSSPFNTTLQRQSQSQSQLYYAHNRHAMHQKTVASTNPFLTANDVHYTSSSYGNNMTGNYSADQNHAPSNIDKSGSILTKTKAEFLHNLNAKLAKQGISGRAFAVRNLINSKALPDPRQCHESLMDQIKRGATLKRNRTINDRSAPKIR